MLSLTALVNIFFPSFCIICKKGGKGVCDQCIKTIRKRRSQCCYACGEQQAGGLTCSECKSVIHFDTVIIAAYYDQIIQKIIKSFKYRSLYCLKNMLCDLLMETIKQYEFRADYLASVPLHKKRFFWRGYNQCELLARELEKPMNITFKRLLIQTKSSDFQSYQPVEERSNNVKNKFEIEQTIDIKGKHILLIDDVVTSGSTLNECSRVLKESGASKVICLVIASRRWM